MRGSYPESYLNFVKREDWFLAVKSRVQKLGMVKDKSLKTKAERRESLHANAIKAVKQLLVL